MHDKCTHFDYQHFHIIFTCYTGWVNDHSLVKIKRLKHIAYVIIRQIDLITKLRWAGSGSTLFKETSNE